MTARYFPARPEVAAVAAEVLTKKPSGAAVAADAPVALTHEPGAAAWALDCPVEAPTQPALANLAALAPTLSTHRLSGKVQCRCCCRCLRCRAERPAAGW